MTGLQKQFEQETGRVWPNGNQFDSHKEFIGKRHAYWKAYAKWLEPKAQPKVTPKPATSPPSDDTKAVIDYNYFRESKDMFIRRIVLAHCDGYASVNMSGMFYLTSPLGRLVAIRYSVFDGKIQDKQFEYYSVEGECEYWNCYPTDKYFDVELQHDGGGSYCETVIMFKNTEAKLEHTT